MLEARSDRSSSTGGRRGALASRLVFLNPRAFSRGLESRDTYRGGEGILAAERREGGNVFYWLPIYLGFGGQGE